MRGLRGCCGPGSGQSDRWQRGRQHEKRDGKQPQSEPGESGGAATGPRQADPRELRRRVVREGHDVLEELRVVHAARRVVGAVRLLAVAELGGLPGALDDTGCTADAQDGRRGHAG